MIGLIVLVLLCGGVSAGSHSLRYFLTSMTPIPSFPEFVGVGYVDDVQFVMYDSDRHELIPREQGMVESEGPEAWARKKFLIQEQELYFKKYFPILMSRSNQSGGTHMYQMLTGCDLRDDGTSTGFVQRGWDGRDLMSFDRDHMVWVTPVQWAESIKNRWNQDMVTAHQWKNYLEEECIEWLRKYLQYGQQELRVVTPVVSFTRPGGSNRLSCVVIGFYPQAIEVTLWRDGVMINETLSSGILPNHDRTYQIRKWIEFDPEDQAEYSCRVEHSGLTEMMVLIYGLKSDSQVPVTVGIVLGIFGLIFVLAIVAVAVYKRKVAGKSGYNPTNISDEGESSSSSSTSA
ncbi:major histocompatibility complex class I-related gene protein-like isoform X2 [Heterodontus francisci]|uniref:major histocompatibility complex class I-related gene protein-like isoform X2 n=1 Tax=Heterodontus francisci TaxID=7792 RepID=UPI00355BFBE0